MAHVPIRKKARKKQRFFVQKHTKMGPNLPQKGSFHTSF